jgi:hypothetical protein
MRFWGMWGCVALLLVGCGGQAVTAHGSGGSSAPGGDGGASAGAAETVSGGSSAPGGDGGAGTGEKLKGCDLGGVHYDSGDQVPSPDCNACTCQEELSFAPCWRATSALIQGRSTPQGIPSPRGMIATPAPARAVASRAHS